jgi:hypothetical protein
MKKYTAFFLILHTAMLFVAGGGVWFILHRFFPDTLVDYYFIIPLFFYLLGLVFIFRFRRTPIDEPKKIVNLYMMMRMIKIFMSFVIIIFDWILDKQHIRNFAIIFIIFYLLNLVWETYIYLRMELYFRYKGKQRKEAGQ